MLLVQIPTVTKMLSFALRLNLDYTDYQCFLWTAQSANTSSLNKVFFCFTVSDDQ